ncbi:hypothetical protein [Streptomyces sp. Ru73]|uniref:hypothetical protein n=1 Tax=Streptomyces sp. Ru73 TaxID=2080748 RepID=UPI0011B09693|nr:hypothetical protein [Streptomyces sp. Ru73]
MSTVRSGLPGPLSLAAALTTPTRADLIEDPLIARVRAIRTALGLAATAWLLLTYPLREGRADYLFGQLLNLLIGCGVLLVCGTVGITVFCLGARRPLGRMYARRVGGPLRALAALPLGAGLVWLMTAVLRGDAVSTSMIGAHDFFGGFFGTTAGTLISGLIMAAAFLAGGLVCLCVLVSAACFTLVAAVRGLNSCFRTADVHELLPAVLSPLLVWSLFVVQLVDGPDVVAPPVVFVPFLLGGPLSVTALAVWEVRRLRTRYGVTLRSAWGR